MLREQRIGRFILAEKHRRDHPRRRHPVHNADLDGGIWPSPSSPARGGNAWPSATESSRARRTSLPMRIPQRRGPLRTGEGGPSATRDPTQPLKNWGRRCDLYGIDTESCGDRHDLLTAWRSNRRRLQLAKPDQRRAYAWLLPSASASTPRFRCTKLLLAGSRRRQERFRQSRAS